MDKYKNFTIKTFIIVLAITLLFHLTISKDIRTISTFVENFSSKDIKNIREKIKKEIKMANARENIIKNKEDRELLKIFLYKLKNELF